MNSFAPTEFVTGTLIGADGWVGDEPMPEFDDRNRHDNQYGSGNTRGRPKNVVDLFWRLGYDLNDNDDIQRLAADFRWMMEERKRAEERTPHRFTFWISMAAAAVGSVVTAVLSWFFSRH